MSIFSPIDLAADKIVYQYIGLSPDSLSGSALQFFIYDTVKIFILLLFINYLMAIVRHFLPVERIRDLLKSRKWYGFDYLLAALFGVLTPFCSCSSIPLFIGFLRAGLPLGLIFSFMITSPLVNEASLVMFIGLFGLNVAIFYALAGITVGVIGGMIINRLKMEQYINPSIKPSANLDHNHKQINSNTYKFSLFTRLWRASGILEGRNKVGLLSVIYNNKDLLITWWKEGWQITKQLMPYVLIGIGIGSLIHGFVPANFFEQYLTGSQLLAVPVATILAIPLYSNAVGVIPIMQALVAKGVPFGTALAFMMSVVGMSLPELLILKKVVRAKLLFLYYALVATGIIIIGYLANIFYN